MLLTLLYIPSGHGAIRAIDWIRRIQSRVVRGITRQNLVLHGTVSFPVRALSRTNRPVAMSDVCLATRYIISVDRTFKYLKGRQWLVEWDLMPGLVNTSKSEIAALLYLALVIPTRAPRFSDVL